MSIKEVTYYQVVCDEPDCDIDTNDLSEYSAWSDPGAAIDEWVNADGAELPDGRHMCAEHARAYRCVDCDDLRVEKLLGEDGERRCPPCDERWHDPCEFTDRNRFAPEDRKFWCNVHGGWSNTKDVRCTVASRYDLGAKP